jgi:hypothetical protein
VEQRKIGDVLTFCDTGCHVSVGQCSFNFNENATATLAQFSHTDSITKCFQCVTHILHLLGTNGHYTTTSADNKYLLMDNDNNIPLVFMSLLSDCRSTPYTRVERGDSTLKVAEQSSRKQRAELRNHSDSSSEEEEGSDCSVVAPEECKTDKEHARMGKRLALQKALFSYIKYEKTFLSLFCQGMPDIFSFSLQTKQINCKIYIIWLMLKGDFMRFCI